MFAVIHIPNFSLQAVLRDEPGLDNRPVAVTGGEAPKPLILQANSVARRHDVVPGLTASQAVARCESLLIKARCVAREKTATEILLQVAGQFSAGIESTDAGVCTLELKGLSLAEPQAKSAWAAEMVKNLTAFHLDAGVGLASTPELALLAARLAAPVLLIDDLPAFLAELPIEAVNPPPRVLAILHLWGIQKMGALIALGKDRVLERLGEEAAELFDRVSLASIRPLKQITPPEHFAEEISFENEIETLEPLLNHLHRFIGQLTGRLDLAHLVTAELELEIGLVSGEKFRRTFKIPEPTNQIEILFRTLRTHLETVRAASPVNFLSLLVTPVKPQGHQFGLFEATLRNPNQFSETLARLAALCGADRLGCPVLEPTHRPDAFRLQAPNFDRVLKDMPRDVKNGGPVLRRFRPPVPAVVEGREHLHTIRSHIFRGPIAKAEGPFLISGQWWESSRWSREEWDVLTAEGATYRIFRCREGDFIEGVYD